MDCKYRHAGTDYNTLEEAFESIKTSNEVYKKMIPIITNAGITIMGIKEYEKHVGYSIEDNVRGLADLSRMIIATDDIRTLPEEFSHFVDAQYVGTDVHNYLLEQVRKLPIYEYVKENYNYDTEIMYAREALGKLMHNVIVEQSTKSPLRKILARMFNAIRRAIKGNADLKVFLQDYADQFEHQEIKPTEGVMYNLDNVVEKGRVRLEEARKTIKVRDKIDKLLNDIEVDTKDEALTKIVEYVKSQGLGALKLLGYNTDTLAKEREVETPNADMLKGMRDFINNYMPYIDEIIEYQVDGDKVITQENINKLNNIFSRVKAEYNNYNYKHTVRLIDLKMAKDHTLDINDPDFYEKQLAITKWDYRQELKEPTKNVSFYTRWLGSLHDASNVILRFLYSKVQDINTAIRNNSIDKGRELANKAKELGIKNFSKFFERKDGKKTGFFNVGYRLGDHNAEYEELKKELEEKHGKYSEEYKEGTRAWKRKNVVRPFIDVYYELRDKLSADTELALDDIQQKIRLLTTRKGKDLSKYKEADIKELNDLRRAKKNLANIYYELDGSMKRGKDLEIAKELQEYYEKMDELFIENYEEFEKFTKDMTPEEKKLNTQIKYDQEFYKLLEQMEKTEYGEEYDSLNERKKKLLSLYRIDIQNIDTDAIPNTVKKEIIEIEKKLRELRKTKKTKKKNVPFITRTNPKFIDGLNGATQEWLDLNTIDGVNPAPFWTFIEPKNKDYIKEVPSRFFIENNDKSKYANPEFDKNFLGMQPTSEWKSETNYTPKEQEFLDYLLSLKKDMDYDLPIPANYKVPQILDTVIRNRNKKGLEIWQKGYYTQDEDLEFTRERNLISRYTKLIDNPDLVSEDLLGSFAMYINQHQHYVQYEKQVASLELIEDLLTQGNTKDVARDFLDRQVYNIQEKEYTIPKDVPVIGGVNVNKVVKKFSGYTRTLNLAWNMITTLSGAYQATTASIMERILGEHVNVQSSLFARKEFMKNLPSVFTEIGNVNKTNRLYLTMEKFGLVDPNFNNTDMGRLTKKAIESGIYWSYEVTDFFIKGHSMLTQLDNHRKVNGKFITRKEAEKLDILDQYELATSAYDSNLTNEEFLYLNKKINYITNKLDGKLNPEDYSAIHKSFVGQLVTMHRGWLFSGISKRLRGEGYNFSLYQVDEGYYRTTVKFVLNNIISKDRVKTVTELLSRWNELTDVEKNAVKRTFIEHGIAIATIGGALLINAAADDDESAMMKALAFLSNRAVLETNAFTFPLFFKEINATIRDPFVPARTFEQTMNFMDMAFGSEEIEQGTYKGMTKRERAILRLIPVYKSLQQLQNTEPSNQFLKNKVLNLIY